MQELPDVLACMVSGAVEEDDRVLSPIGPLLVQGQDQVPKEHQHHILVSVSLGQGEVDPALYVQGSDQRQPRRHRLLGHCGRRANQAPNLSDVAGRVDPALIDVEDDFA